MQPGELVGGRFRLVAEVTGDRVLERWRAVATDTGEPVEVLALRPAASRPEGARAFVAAHRHLLRTDEPGLIRTLAVLDAPHPMVVRAALEDRALSGVSGPLPAETVAAIGAALVPAVLAAGPATGASLTDDDIGLDAAGRPVLAPRVRPLSQVDRAVATSAAPESFDGAAADGPAGLYGLGVVLYRLAAGRAPRRGGSPPPPSALNHRVPPALDAAILRLMSRDPADRAAALPALQEIAGPLEDLRDQLTARDVGPPAAEPGSLPAARATLDAAPDALVLIDSDDLAALDPASRSAAAGWAGTALAVVDSLVQDALPLVLEHHPGASRARARAAQLSRDSGLPVRAVARRGIAPVIARTAAALAVVLAAAGAGLAALGLLIVAVPLLVFAGVPTAIALGAWARGAPVNARHARGQRALSSLGSRAAMDPALAPAWERLAALRRGLGGLDLPEAAAVDVRGLLKELEHRLTSLGAVRSAADQALSRVDVARLRVRSAALADRHDLDERQREERDKLARTLADLDAVQSRKDAQRDEVNQIVDSLDEVAGVLAQLEEGPGDGALERLVASVATGRRAPRARERQ